MGPFYWPYTDLKQWQEKKRSIGYMLAINTRHIFWTLQTELHPINTMSKCLYPATLPVLPEYNSRVHRKFDNGQSYSVHVN